MKKHSLMVKLTLLFLSTGLVLFAILNIIGTDAVKISKLKNTKHNLYEDATKFLSDYVMEYYSRNNSNYVELVNQIRLLDEMHGTRVWMVSNKGIVVTDSEKNSECSAVGIDLIGKNPKFLEQVFQEEVYFPEIMEESLLCTILPVIHKYENKGYLVMSVPMSQVEEERLTYGGFVFGVFLCFLLVIGILLFFIYRLVELPTKKITEVATQFSKGIFKETLELD